MTVVLNRYSNEHADVFSLHLHVFTSRWPQRASLERFQSFCEASGSTDLKLRQSPLLPSTTCILTLHTVELVYNDTCIYFLRAKNNTPPSWPEAFQRDELPVRDVTLSLSSNRRLNDTKHLKEEKTLWTVIRGAENSLPREHLNTSLVNKTIFDIRDLFDVREQKLSRMESLGRPLTSHASALVLSHTKLVVFA